MATQLALATVIGVGATMAMDVWNLFLRRVFRIPSLDYCLLGRWVRHMPGTFRHDNIKASPSKRYECATGWLGHYTIGVSLAVVFVLIVSAEPEEVPGTLEQNIFKTLQLTRCRGLRGGENPWSDPVSRAEF